MHVKHKIREILKYVWHPKIDLNNIQDLEKLDLMAIQVDALLDSYLGSFTTLNQQLQQFAAQFYPNEVSKEKSEQTAQLLMAWYFTVEPIMTDYGRVRLIYSMYNNKSIQYQRFDLNHYYQLGETYEEEIILYLDDVDLSEIEKQQLIEAIKKMIRPAQLIFYEESISERIKIGP